MVILEHLDLLTTNLPLTGTGTNTHLTTYTQTDATDNNRNNILPN